MTGVYLHIPYCMKKCSYCDFTSFPACDELEDYVNALCKEIRLTTAALSEPEKIASVFLGGGTPSLLSGEQLKKILTTVQTCFFVLPGAEISMECNPGTAVKEKLTDYRNAGVNRLSIGLQSTSDRLLAVIGRIHFAGDFFRTYSDARASGFQNINIDVMHGLPGQTQDDYLETLHAVTAIKPEHISSYALILEAGTPLFNRVKDGACALPSEDCTADMEDAGFALLAENGYLRYEISNFARDGFFCRHNINYWKNGEYYGFGLAAHGAKTVGGQWTRFENVKDRQSYFSMVAQGKRPLSRILEIPKTEEMFETVMVGLRMIEGINLAAFSERFHVTIYDAFPAATRTLRDLGWLRESSEHFALNERGLDVQNRALALFLN